MLLVGSSGEAILETDKSNEAAGDTSPFMRFAENKRECHTPEFSRWKGVVKFGKIFCKLVDGPN
jgi:hypothetical protein